jgi:hypothetical protein
MSKRPYYLYTENRSKTERETVREYMRLAQYEPRLLDLLTEIMAEQPTTDEWYSPRWKGRLCNLVGFDGGNPQLRTMAAYDTVYELCYSYCFDPPPRKAA